MKNKFLSLVLAICMIIPACFMLAACGKDDDNTANLPKWNGTVGVVPTAVENVIEIENGEQLAAVAAFVNRPADENVYSYRGYTIKLVSDINLNDKEWTPIGIMEAYGGGSGFAGTFDGNGHTIYNLKVNDTTEDCAAAGLFGGITAGAVIKNVTLKNVNITSYHWVGGVVGYISENGTPAQIENCHIDGGVIKSIPELIDNEYDNGDKVGGIAGYTYNATIKNCSVKNVALKGYRDIGGIVGYADAKTTVQDNVVGGNVIINVDKTHNYKNYTENTQYDANSIIGEIGDASVVDNGNTGTATIAYQN